MKTTMATIIVAIILIVQERISQAHESVDHLAGREGLEDSGFAPRIDAICSKKGRVNYGTRSEKMNE